MSTFFSHHGCPRKIRTFGLKWKLSCSARWLKTQPTVSAAFPRSQKP